MVTYEVSAITGLVKPQQPVGVPPQPQQVQQPAAPMGQPAQNPSRPTSGASQQAKATYVALLKTKYEYQNAKDPKVKAHLKKVMDLMAKSLKAGDQQFMSGSPEWIAFMATYNDGGSSQENKPTKKPNNNIHKVDAKPLVQKQPVNAQPTPAQTPQPKTPSQGGNPQPKDLPKNPNATQVNAAPNQPQTGKPASVNVGPTPTKVTNTGSVASAKLPASESNTAPKAKTEADKSAEDKIDPKPTSENVEDKTGTMLDKPNVDPGAFRAANKTLNANTSHEELSGLGDVVATNDSIPVEQADVTSAAQNLGITAPVVQNTVQDFNALASKMPDAQDAGTTVNQAEDVAAGLNPQVENPVPDVEGQVPPPTKQNANDQLVNDPTVESNTTPEVIPQPATETPTPEAKAAESPEAVGQDNQPEPVKPIEVQDGDGNKIEIPATSKDAAEDEARSRGIPVSGSQNQNETGTQNTPMTGEQKSETPPEQPTSQAEATDATEGVKPEDADRPVPLDEHYKPMLDEFKKNLQDYYGKPSKTLDDAENFLRKIRDGFRQYNAFLSGGVSGLVKEKANQFEQSGVRENDKKILAEREKQANNLADSWAEKMTLLKTQPDAGLNPTQSAEMTTALSKLDAKQRAMVGEMLSNELGLDKPADQYTPGDLKVRFDQYIKSQTEKSLLKESEVQRQKSAHDAMVKKINAGETIPDNQLKSFASELTSLMKTDPTHLNEIANGLGVTTVGKTNEQIKKDVIDAVSAKTETATAKAKQAEERKQFHHKVFDDLVNGNQPSDEELQSVKDGLKTADDEHVKSLSGRLGLNPDAPVDVQKLAIKNLLSKQTKKARDESIRRMNDAAFVESRTSQLKMGEDPTTGAEYPLDPIDDILSTNLKKGFSKLDDDQKRNILESAGYEGLDSITPDGYDKAYSELLKKHTSNPITQSEQRNMSDSEDAITLLNSGDPLDGVHRKAFVRAVNKAHAKSEQDVKKLAQRIKGFEEFLGTKPDGTKRTISNTGGDFIKDKLIAFASQESAKQEPTGEVKKETKKTDEGNDGADGGNDGGSTVTPPTPQPTPTPASGTPTPTETPEPVASTPIDEPPAAAESPVPAKEQPKPTQSTVPAATGLGDEYTRREGLSEKLQSYFDNNPDDPLAVARSKAYGQLSAAEQRELTHGEKNSDVLAQLDKIADNIKNGRDKLEGTKIAEIRKGTAEAKASQPAEAAKLQQQVEYTPEIQEKIKGLDADAQRVIEATKPKTVDEWRRLAIKLGVEANDKIAQQIKNTPKAANNEQKAKLEAEKARVEKQIANLRDIANMVGGSPSQPTTEVDKPETPPATADRKAISKKLIGGLEKSNLSLDKQKEYGESVESLVQSMPESAVLRVDQHVKDTKFYEDNQSITDYLATISPKVQAAKDAGKKVGGAYNFTTGELYLDGGFNDQTPSEIHAHELTHAIDGPNHEYSKDPEWKKAFLAETQNFQLSAYASQSPSEAFAEFGRMVYGRKVAVDDLKAKFPQMAAFFESKGLLPASGSAKAAIPEMFEGKPIEDNGKHVDKLLIEGDKPATPPANPQPAKKEIKPLPKIPAEKAPDYDVGKKINEVFDGIAKGTVSDKDIIAVVAQLEGMSKEDLLKAARAAKVEYGLTSRSSKKAIKDRIQESLNSTLRTTNSAKAGDLTPEEKKIARRGG